MIERSEPDDSMAFAQLPTDARGSLDGGFEAALHTVPVSSRVSGSLDALGEAKLLAAFEAFVFRHTQQPQVAIDVFRQDGPSQAKALCLRSPVNAELPVAALIQRAQLALANVDMRTETQRTAASNVALTFGSAVSDDAAALPVPSQHDLHLMVDTTPSASPLALRYNAKLFQKETIERLARSFVSLLEAVLADERTPLHRLPVLDAEQMALITREWDSGTATYPELPVVAIFADFARVQPDAVALMFQGDSLTYGQLDERSSLLARHLVANHVRLETPVAVCVMPGFEILVAMLAIWKAGGTYVPLDPTHPAALIHSILAEAEPALVLTQSKLQSVTQPERWAQFCFDADAHLLEGLPLGSPAVPTPQSALAYLLYTSGTTGKPKGVRATHGNLAHYINVAQQTYRFTGSDVFCSFARYTFSISMFELISPLCCGGSLRLFERDEVLAPNRLATNLQGITVMHAGPSLLGSLFRYLREDLAAPKQFQGLRHVSSGGDLVPPHVLEEMKEVFPNAEIYVIYGSTEISCMGCTYPVSRSEKVTTSLVGRPFPDVDVRVLDPQRNVAPIGVVGEICFAGKGVVDGYYKRPELTAEKFVDVHGSRYYTTGDMGRLHADGNLEILGRRDFQVQLRGIRIELGGIENTVKQLGLAVQCAVVMKKLDEQDARLIAFVVSPKETTISGLRRALALHLPDYMLPQGMVVLEAMPLTANGKLDRRKLQELPWEAEATAEGTAPRNKVEQQIAASFAEALGVAKVNIDDDFFDLGGHSLLAVTVMRDVESRLGLTLAPGVLFEQTSVRKLAEHVATSFTSVPKPLLLAGSSDQPAVFMLVGVHLYRELARRLQHRYSVYGVYAGRELVIFEKTGQAVPIVDLAREYIEIIRRQQPAGPYRLAGMSMGGIVAYEVAQQLRDAGEEVAFLALIDSVLPEPGWRGRWGKAKRFLTMKPHELARALQVRLRSRWEKARSRPAPSAFVKFTNDEVLGQMELQRADANARTVAEYAHTMRPFAGEITLAVAGARLHADPGERPDCGWTNYTTKLEQRTVPTDHFGLVEEPNVEQTAALFLAGLTRSEAPVFGTAAIRHRTSSAPALALEGAQS